MVTNAGFGASAAYGLQPVWDTPVAVTHALAYTGDSLDQNRPPIARPLLRGIGAPVAHRPGPKNAGGAINGFMAYELQQDWLIHYFGQFNDEAVDNYSMLDEVTSSLTLDVDRVVSVHEYQGTVIGQLTLAGNSKTGVTWAWNVISKERIRTGKPGIVNDKAAMDALDEPGRTIFFDEVTVRIGPVNVALTAAHDLAPSQFNLVHNRNNNAPNVNRLTVLQPKGNGFRGLTLSVTLPRYETDQFFDWEEDGTELQSALIMTDGTNTKEVRMPHMKVSQVPVSNNDDSQAEVPITLLGYHNKAQINTNTGFDFDPEWQLFES